MTSASKIIIAIVSIITVIAILIGVFLHIVKGFSFDGSTHTVENTVELDGTLSEIIMDIDFAEISIKTGDEFSVNYCVPSVLEPKIELKNGTLEIKTPSNNLNLHFGNVKFDNYIIVTIPSDSELARINIDVDAGEVNLEDLNVSKLQVAADAGNIQLDNITSTRMEIDADTGNLEIRKSSTDTLNIDVDAGNVELYDSTIGTITAEVDAGNIESHDCTIENGTCDTDLGNISLKGNIGDVSAHTSLGNAYTEKKSA